MELSTARSVRSIVAFFVLVWASPLVAAGATVSGGGLSLEIDTQGRIVGVEVEGRVLRLSRAWGGLQVRDLTGAATGSGLLLLDEGWEGSGSGWEVHEQSQEVAFTFTDEDAYEGSQSLLCQVVGGDENQRGLFVSPVIPVVSQATYRLQCRYRATRGYLSHDCSTIGHQRDVYDPESGVLTNGLGVFWTDASGQLLSENRRHIVPLVGEAPRWKAAGGELTVPPGVHHLRVAITASLDPGYANEGFLVDAVKLFPCPAAVEPLRGSVTQAGENVQLQGSAESFTVSAEWRSLPQSIELSGTVSNADGQPHPFDLVLSVPVDADDGWLWLDDSETQREISDTGEYSNCVSADIQGYLPVSLYPYGGIQDDESGLAASVGLQPTGTTLIRYHAGRGALEVVWHLGVDAGLAHPTARFSARLFSSDPAHGFRSIIRGYRESYREKPGWFSSPFDASGFVYWHQGAYTGADGARACAEDDTAGIMSMQYTCPDFVVDQVCQAQEPPPTFWELMDLIEDRKTSGGACQRYYYAHVNEQTVADTSGDPVLKYLGQKAWTGSWVQAAFKINPSPHASSDGYHSYEQMCSLEPAFSATGSPDPGWGLAPSVLDAVLLDNFLSHPSHDASAVRVSLSGDDLTYAVQDYSLALPFVAGTRDYLEHLRAWLDSSVDPPRRAIAVNWKGLGNTQYCLPWIDICADEVSDFIAGGQYGAGARRAYEPALLRYKRAMAFHKLRGTAFSGSGIGPEDVVDTLHYALLLGHAAGFKEETVLEGISREDVISLCSAHNRMVADLHRAGWEPVTLAEGSDPDLAIERFGTPERGLFYLVVANLGQTAVTAEVVLDPELGIFQEPRVTERLGGVSVAATGTSPAWTIPVTGLAPRRSRLFEVRCLPSPRRVADRVRPSP